MTVTNSNDQNYLTVADTLVVSTSSRSSNYVDLVVPGNLTRLAPGQSAIVQVKVKNKAGVAADTLCTVDIVATYGQAYDSLNNHWNPDWYNNVKSGIFIHWGPYSAPAYGSVAPNEDYAEWYWMRQHQPSYKTQINQYHLEIYGENFICDDFMSNFTGAAWDPKEWMNLIADSGTHYFALVTKHHNGFALFDFLLMLACGLPSIMVQKETSLENHLQKLKNIILEFVVGLRIATSCSILDPCTTAPFQELCKQVFATLAPGFERMTKASYDTRYWSVTPGTGQIRYTTTADAFCIHYMGAPPLLIPISDPVPWLPGDTVTVLGGNKNDTIVPVTKSDDVLNLTLTEDIVQADTYVWSFKLSYTSDR
ncbi:hypothetical protein TSTA_024450 [Talaromyces stipitatus ATCC 10500]|uniref:alpha-L-fucosidase n=1 Tax=Talaromyces stipitatus (strain ATCC 10500 / CBS 375.48 / QM 6759 / NRRL 1006) TaxID=441959 RepID=B8M4C6_TALSN|nr:uncharacterized protein TSTA_024450 [Talaromyces stipitatus ATCC 10500]EED19121.1 hypothetical protein TSTA_024450 [Talaromyces stipitatus ATCC 10500]